MPTSGTITFNETLTTIVTNTLSLLNVVAAGESVSAADMTLCTSLLNQMIKAWMAQGIHLFTEEEGTLFLVNGQNQYLLAAGNSTHVSDGTGTPVETSLSATASNGATTLNVTTSVGMSANDIIGIQLSTTSIQWTTVSSVPTTTSVIINTPLTASAASGNQVFTYTTQCPRVLSIQNARLRDNNNFDRMIKIEPRQVYDMIPQKLLPGDPIILYYSPQLTQGIVYVWPTPSDVSKRIEFTYLRELQDITNAGDNIDFPQEWLECVVYNLAVRAAPAYGINLASGGIGGNPDLLRMATSMLDQLLAWDSEQPYISIIPGYRFNNQ